MFKTKIKRFEFSTTIIMIAFFAIVAGIMLLSAYGWSCVALDATRWGAYGGGIFGPGRAMPPYDYGVISYEWYINFGVFLQISYYATWILCGAWGFVIYSFLTNRKWAYMSALVVSAISFVIGMLPALLSDTNGFTFAESWQIPYAAVPVAGNWVAQTFEFGIGSPHWAKAFASLLVFIVILPYPKSPITKSLKSFSSRENRWAPGVSRQLTYMSVFFLFLAAFSFLGSGFMADAHIVGGVNVWEIVAIQNIGGVVTAVIGSSMLVSGLLYKKFKSPQSLTTILE